MSEWQPIDTAPKDGTPVLLYGRIEWETYGKRTDAPRTVVGAWDSEAYRGDFDGGWVLVNANPYVDFCHATHWMFLPKPPKTTD